MSKIFRTIASAALIAGALALVPGSAQARWHGGWHGGWHHGWHGGGWGWGWPAFGAGLGLGYVASSPYYYAPYYGGGCGWRPIRVWRHGYWVVRRVWRCY
jgi:hypothetical protein